MGPFRSMIDKLELKDIKLNGRMFTWSNEREQATMCRLDRVLCSADWEALFPACALCAASTSVSDHCQLLLSGDLSVPKNRSFRFESFWLRMPGIADRGQGCLGEAGWKC